MKATFNSQYEPAAKWRFAAAIFLFVAEMALADDAPDKIFAARAEAEFHHAQIQFESNTNSSAAARQFARACYDFADFATNKTERATIANQGVAACRQIIARDTNSVAAHYYLGMNLGQLARTKSLGALKIIREMESEFKAAEALDPQFDYAGPERNLGLLYRDAPGWPASIGSKRKASDCLKHALQLAPDYPENHLNLIETFLQWHENDSAKSELKTLDALWPVVQKKFIGGKWGQSWNDWSARRDNVRETLSEVSAPATSPKNTR